MCSSLVRRGVVLACGTMLAASCGTGEGGGDGEGETVVRDSAGIQIVEVGSGVVPQPWTAREQVSIGSLDGGPEDTFNQVVDLEVGPAGEVYVLDRGDNLVKAYGAEGGFLFQVGGEGDGPSEFRRAAQLVVGEEGFAVFDYQAPKLAHFGWDGAFQRSVRTELSVFEYGFPSEWARIPGGAAVVLNTGCSLPRPEDLRPFWKLLTLDEDASIRDTVMIRPRLDVFAIYGESFCTSSARPGGVRPRLAVRSDGVVALGEGSTYEVALLQLAAAPEPRYSGTPPTPARRVRRHVEPEPLAAATLDEYREAQTNPPEGEPLDRDRLEAYEAAWDTLGFPEFYPAFASLRWDDRGRLWVGRTAREDTELRTWDIFSEKGELLGTVELPAALSVRAIGGGTVWGFLQDELDVMYVKGFELEEVTPAAGS